MDKSIALPQNKPALLERFGIFYLNLFGKKDLKHNVFGIADDVLHQKVNRITAISISLTCLVSLLCVFPTVWVDVHFSESPWTVHYSWVIAVTGLSILVELYLLFIIALKAVHLVSELLNMHATQKDFLRDGAFSVINILSRTALELPDPELEILGIDPFKRISKKNLFVLGLFYKAKILLTNFILKNLLLLFIGKSIFGVSVLYESLFVECFWNSIVIIKVIHEARLRLFGFTLAHKIADTVLAEKILEGISPTAKSGCIRAIGNAVVMAQNYHPNMIILLLQFQALLHIDKQNKYDDWNLFLDTLKQVNENERNLLLDIFTIAAAFDGKISHLEADNLKNAYGEEFNIYHGRLLQLTEALRLGKLNTALNLCKIDFEAG